jgi:hypothetical protein
LSDFFFGTGEGKSPFIWRKTAVTEGSLTGMGMRDPKFKEAKAIYSNRKQNCDEWTPEGGTGDSLRETAETEIEYEARRMGGEA